MSAGLFCDDHLAQVADDGLSAAVFGPLADPAVWWNVFVTISGADVAALAREAVDRIDPDLDVRIEPADPVDPYRWETAAWTVHAGSASSYIVASMSEQEALEKLSRDLAR